MPRARNRVSNEAVKRATGKDWDAWIQLLDREGARAMTHRDSARMLGEKGYIKSGWWRQMVTVGYEYARGRRVLGETATAGYEMGVQKTLPLSAKATWELVFSPRGRRAWLGTSSTFRLVPGKRYTTKEGTTGEIRAPTKAKRLRLTWQPKGWKKPSMLQFFLLSRGKNTSLRIHQEQLPNTRTRTHMRAHWRKVLAELDRLARGAQRTW